MKSLPTPVSAKARRVQLEPVHFAERRTPCFLLVRSRSVSSAGFYAREIQIEIFGVEVGSCLNSGVKEVAQFVVTQEHP